MVPHLLLYPLLRVASVRISFLLSVWWPDEAPARQQTPRQPDTPRTKRSQAPKPFPGLLRQPLWAACSQAAAARPQGLGAPPPLIISTRGESRGVRRSSAGYFSLGMDVDVSFYFN
jgi:hypothetical protein